MNKFTPAKIVLAFLSNLSYCIDIMNFKSYCAGICLTIIDILAGYSRVGKIKIFSLVLLLITTLLPSAVAQSKDTVSVKVDIAEVEVSVFRAPVIYSQAGRSIEMKTRADIEKMPVFSVDQLLDMMQQIDIRQRGPLGVQSDIGIRGGSFDQIVILLNGINITDPQTGHFNLNLPIDLGCIEKVEVLEGPAARVYGPNAFSGAINLITGSNRGTSTVVNASGGSFGLASTSLAQTIKAGQSNHFISGSLSRSDGYVADTDFRSRNLFYQGNVLVDNSKIELQAGYNSKDYGALTFYSDKYPSQYEENRTTFGSLKFVSGSKVKHTSQAYWRRNTDMFDLKRYDSNNKINHHLTDVYGVKQNFTIPWTLGRTSIGGELRSESVWSTTLGNIMESPKPVPGYDAEYTRSFSRNNAALFAEHIYHYGNLTVGAGVLVNANSSLDWKVTLFPGVDMSYLVGSNVKLFATVNKALRLPTFTDLFYLDPVQKGNVDLRPEEAVSIEGGIGYYRNALAIVLSSYHQQADELIDWGKAQGESMYQSRNISNMKSYGVQTSAKFDFTKIWSDRAFLQSINAGYFYNTQNKKAEDGYESRFVMDYLRQKLVVSLFNRLPSDVLLSWNVKFQDRNGTFLKTGSSDRAHYKPFWIADLRISREFKMCNLYAEASNLFDQKYEDIANVPQPGLWLRAGIKIKIDY